MIQTKNVVSLSYPERRKSDRAATPQCGSFERRTITMRNTRHTGGTCSFTKLLSMILELTDKEKERLNRISKATGETPAAVLKAILMAYGTPAALPVPGPGTHGLKMLIAILQPYLDELIQMGTLSDGTRQAAADFYDNLLMDLAVEARREGKRLKISKSN